RCGDRGGLHFGRGSEALRQMVHVEDPAEGVEPQHADRAGAQARVRQAVGLAGPGFLQGDVSNNSSPLPACGERSDREAIRVKGTLHASRLWRLPLTPTLSPHAGRGSAPAAWPLFGSSRLRSAEM